MSPTGFTHANIEVTIATALKEYVRPQKLGWILAGEVGIYTRRNPDRVRGADVAFISRERLPSRPQFSFLEVAPELIVEILSPHDPWQQVRQKIEEYFSIGVERVWIVEPENRAVLVFRSPTEAQEIGEDGALRGEGPLAGFALSLADLFAE
jgi:Uma2 family endonuclease